MTADTPPLAGEGLDLEALEKRLPMRLPEGIDGRDMCGETVMGMRVAGWREESRYGPEYGYTTSYHWSTPGAGAVNVERLFTEADVRKMREPLCEEIKRLRATHSPASGGGEVEKLRAALSAVLDTSGARGSYHALKYGDAVEAAEALLSEHAS